MPAWLDPCSAASETCSTCGEPIDEERHKQIYGASTTGLVSLRLRVLPPPGLGAELDAALQASGKRSIALKV